MKATKTTDRIVTIRCRAFAGDRLREHRCLVSADGTVRVWDAVAGHYTTCHSMSPQAQQRARRAPTCPEV